MDRKTATLMEKLTKTSSGRRLYEQERAVQEVTDLICEEMQRQGVSNRKLARLLKCLPLRVNRMLDGQVGMTIRQLSDVCVALGVGLHFELRPLMEDD